MFYKSIQFKEDSRYIFAASLANAMRLRICTYPEYERLLESDVETLLSFLAEKDYDTSLKDTEMILQKSEEKLLSNVIQFCKENAELKEYFLFPYDLFNLKTLFKGFLKEEKFEKLSLYHFGTLTLEQLRKFYDGEEMGQVSPVLKEFMKRFNDEIEDRTPFDIDVLWDKYLHQFYLNQAKKLNNDFLLKIHSLKIDLTNILNLFRLKSFDKEYKVYQKVFIKGGKLDLYTLSDLYKEDMDIIHGKLVYLDYSEEMKKGIEGFKKENSLSVMEKELEDFHSEYIGQAFNRIFGYEGIIAYYWKKMAEINNLRLITTAKSNSIQKEWILSRLRG
ncbi:MAG TPA: hypothetical protein DHW82_07300 [Spirochaetia bacterium]|nr:MAG: hypothetical protein A2Y41_00565 [Spirochaetes bacterium GWB1_36_13]HCL56798.1 hypothetical protein [Spirochaetia bacterium]